MTIHVPIMATPIVDSLIAGAEKFPDGGTLLDLTFGGGGHTGLILDRLRERGLLSRVRVFSIDQDPAAVEKGCQRFAAEIARGELELHRSRISEVCEKFPDRQWIGILADLGFSSDQIENPEKGMSFLKEGPLDMRMDPDRGESVYALLRRIRENELADLIYEYGEERYSRRIASAIVHARTEGQLPTTTTGLAQLIFNAYPQKERHSRLHPATRSFQALRIYVNEELGELDSLLENVMMNLSPGGRIAILSFHSLEDRKVKQAFGDREGLFHGQFRALTKKPIEADDEEVARNPRSRSAKLRVAERIDPEKEAAEDGRPSWKRKRRA